MRLLNKAYWSVGSGLSCKCAGRKLWRRQYAISYQYSVGQSHICEPMIATKSQHIQIPQHSQCRAVSRYSSVRVYRAKTLLLRKIEGNLVRLDVPVRLADSTSVSSSMIPAFGPATFVQLENSNKMARWNRIYLALTPRDAARQSANNGRSNRAFDELRQLPELIAGPIQCLPLR